MEKMKPAAPNLHQRRYRFARTPANHTQVVIATNKLALMGLRPGLP